MSDISLFLDQDNELRFNVSIEGSKPGAPRYRLVLEDNTFSFTFEGQKTPDGDVSFLVPAMKSVLKEGVYKSNLEVMVDDRYFVPLSFDTRFETSIKVTAESALRPAKNRVGVSAAIVSAPRIVETPVKEVQTASKPKIEESKNEFVGTVDGKKITADDLRKLLRTRV